MCVKAPSGGRCGEDARGRHLDIVTDSMRGNV